MGGATAKSKKELLNQTKRKFYDEIKAYQKTLKPTKEIEGFGSAPIVGEKNYPNLVTHNISNEDKKSSFFETANIVKSDYSKIIPLKAKSILGSTNPIYIKSKNLRILDELKDIYKSKKAVEFSSKFENELTFDKILTSKVSGIMGSKNQVQKIEATENTSTSLKIEKYIQEDIKSREAIISLYEKGISEHQIINLLALGSFGLEFNSKMVPTKWAISAFDQTIEKYLQKKILQNTLIENYEIYSYSDKGNYFVIILIPDTFNAEVVEFWGEGLSEVVERDFVSIDNKLKYEKPQTAGGFFATKIAVHEHLISRKKQASYISLRFIKDYDIPLGVVFVRECAREALSKKPLLKTSNKFELELFLKENFSKHYKQYLNSTYLKESKKQKKLSEFF